MHQWHCEVTHIKITNISALNADLSEQLILTHAGVLSHTALQMHQDSAFKETKLIDLLRVLGFFLNFFLL